MAYNETKICCICQREKISFNNPEPIRSADKDCCCECNRLVIKAREKYRELNENERAAYVLYLNGRSYAQLTEELS